MSFSAKIRHYFTPHHTNNFRAKLLHNSGIFFFIGVLLTGNLFVRLLDATPYHILGFTSSITINEVVTNTNSERTRAGLPTLTYSEKLADAARRKAANMLEEDYWAHNSPSGKTPWVWFKAAGYSYLYAGENLAKDFGSTDRMVAAWMASPTHRDNIVNAKYTEIGVAVVPGTLQGKDTMLVVQLFGAPANGTVATTGGGNSTVAEKAVVPAKTPAPTVVPTVSIVDEPEPEVQSATPESVEALVAEIQPQPKLNEFTLKKTMSLATTLLFMLVLVVDLALAESRVLSRRVGKNWAHIIFINVILLATTIVNAGSIL
ncbi:MAG: hypothetical protein DPW11_02930 [bacterium]|nr:CAP domain-containing protein [Candidatus Microgenomates bacterium CPR3]MCQ3944704.1 hypothetical protein [bacterium]RIK51872.1 MAG: hypothetical protein DCC61_01465 [Candidatus Microgenomates bacterium]